MAFSQKINAAAVAVHFRYTDAILRFNSVAGNHWVHRKHTPAEKEWERERENKKIRKNCQELNDCLRAEFFNECEYFCGAFENAATSPCSRYIIIFCNFLLVGREWQQPRDDDGYDDDDDDSQKKAMKTTISQRETHTNWVEKRVCKTLWFILFAFSSFVSFTALTFTFDFRFFFCATAAVVVFFSSSTTIVKLTLFASFSNAWYWVFCCLFFFCYVSALFQHCHISFKSHYEMALRLNTSSTPANTNK